MITGPSIRSMTYDIPFARVGTRQLTDKTGYSEMRNQVDFVKSTSNSEINS